MKRKIALGTGVAALVGMALWLRELASWRPVMVARVDFDPWELRISPNGDFLLATLPAEEIEGAILNLNNFSVDSDAMRIRDFDENHGLESFPRVRLRGEGGQPVFSLSARRNIALRVQATEDRLNFQHAEKDEARFAWSEARNEVYCALGAWVWIWDWHSGKLKKRQRFFYSGMAPVYAVFSPDKKWILMKTDGAPLGCYEVQTGKRLSAAQSSQNYPVMRSFGFSPDGRLIWFVRESEVGVKFNLTVMRAADAKVFWTVPCSGPARWLPDGRIGIVQEQGFSWRDATGRELKFLRGPFQKNVGGIEFLQDWVLSPDGNWIYAAGQDGTILRWRAC